MFLRNSWYVAAWDREVSGIPLGRVFLGEPVVMYRKRNMDLNLSRIDIAVDATPLAARRMLQAMIQQETGL